MPKVDIAKSHIHAYLGYCVTPSNHGLTPGYIAERERVENKSYSDLAGMIDDVA
jgi:hypothetical protein